MKPKFKVGDKIAITTHPNDALYIITGDRGDNTFECKTLRGSNTGIIDHDIIDDWVVAHDDNYRVDKILIKYSTL